MSEQQPARRRTWIKVAVLVVVLTCAAVAAAVVDLPDPQDIRDRVDAAGPWGLVVFFALYAVLSATPFPASALTIAGGVLFGLITGVLLVLVAATIGGMISYLLAGSVGQGLLARVGWTRVRKLDATLASRGLLSVLLVRLIPIFPFWVVSYAAGLSSVSRRDFLVGTAVGIVPGTVGYTALGAYGTSPLSWPFAVAVLAVIVLSVATSYLAPRLGVTKNLVDGEKE
ncbi:MAG: TVP38/TMEM64 family protein [Rhodococcus sp. (in: high G+C Gram-positive bacteria)]